MSCRCALSRQFKIKFKKKFNSKNNGEITLICWFSFKLSLNCDPHCSQIIDRSWCFVNCRCFRYKYFLVKLSLHWGQVNTFAFLRSLSCIVKCTWNCWLRLNTSPQVWQINGYFLECLIFLCSMISWNGFAVKGNIIRISVLRGESTANVENSEQAFFSYEHLLQS